MAKGGRGVERGWRCYKIGVSHIRRFSTVCGIGPTSETMILRLGFFQVGVCFLCKTLGQKKGLFSELVYCTVNCLRAEGSVSSW